MIEKGAQTDVHTQCTNCDSKYRKRNGVVTQFSIFYCARHLKSIRNEYIFLLMFLVEAKKITTEKTISRDAVIRRKK